jgi:amino acid adenylation domain-containing protein
VKPIQKFLSELNGLDVKLWVDETRLRCNAPQGILTPEIRTQLSDRKAEIIKFLQYSQPQTIPRSPRNQPLPLSWAQERLWFFNQLEGLSATYNMSSCVRITGNLYLDALKLALSEIVRRHEVLRTSFQAVNGTPIQVIHPEATMKINMVDLQQHSKTEQKTLVQHQAHKEAITPFDLEIAPLIRCSLLQLEQSEYVLLVNVHHIVSDGWSIGVFIQELSTLYQAFCIGKTSPLPELPIQYADFAVWQRQWLSEEVFQNQLNYWKQQLGDAPELLQLPSDRPRPTVQSYRGTTQSFSLNADLTQKLQTLSQNHSTTLFMTLYAAFATLLYRYSGQSDILIGSGIANRNHSEIESLIGFFVNTLVLRSRFEDNPSFESLLAQVRETILKAYENQDVPFEQVVEALQPQRSLAYSALFQVMFILQNAPMAEVKLPGVTLTQLNQQSTIAKFDLTVSVIETDQGLVGSWEYNTDLFDGSTIEQMAEHFQNLLSAIVENPSQTVGELPLLTQAERHKLLSEWNDTASEYSHKCIHQLFEQQVEKTPHCVAVVFDREQLTYLQLNQTANQLAHHLQTLGVGPEVLVGIYVERSIEMMVGLLGILKAGGVCVPLDPNYPQERLSYMLADSSVGVLLTQQSLLESLSTHTAQVVCLDTHWQLIAAESDINPQSQVQPENLLYVIYTSGSTGLPKGVALCHRTLTNLIEWHSATMAKGVGVLQFASLSFDASFHEIFAAWCSGGTLFLIPENYRLDLDKLVHFLAQNPIQKATLPVVLWQQLLEAYADQPQLFANLTEAIATGEQLQISQQMSNLFSRLDHCKFYNQYGPSETHVVLSYVFTQPPQKWPICPPMGKPIANTQIYILDEHLQPVPVGVCGELYIGGDSLARGYLNRPELTQEKFIPNLFNNSKSERLYKTGDLARYSRDGNIEFLGRIDHQVKIRGFRIELGEIETLLNTHPHIQQAVVIATEDIYTSKRLVAYVVAKDKLLTISQLRQYLRQQLPEYMLPSAFVTLDSLPLTPNGKLDRKALPALDAEITRENKYVAPRTLIEIQLTQIWSQVLNITSVGVRDNFFELGGHSLLAVRLMSRIQLQFQKNLPLAILFQSPTIEQMAVVLSSDSSEKLWSPLVPIQPKGSLPTFFCVPGSGGNALYFYDLAQYLGEDQPFYGLQAQGFDGETKPLGSIEEIASQYINAIQTVQPVGPYFLGGHSFGARVAFEMATQLRCIGQSVAYVAILDTSPASELEVSYSDWDNARWMYAIAGIAEELFGENLQISHEALSCLTPEEQINYFKQQLEIVGILPPQADIKLVRGLLQVFQTQVQIDYVPHNTYPVPITLFLAQEGNSQQENCDHFLQDPTWGWSQFADGEVEVHFVPGTHISMLSKPHVKVLAQKLQKSLEQVHNIYQLEKSNAQTTQN